MGGMGGGPGFSGMLPGLDGSMAFHMPMGIDPASAPGLLHRTETAAASSSMQDTVMPLSMGFPLANMGYPAMPSNTLGMEALQTMSQVRQQHGDGSPNHMNRLPTGGTTSSLQNGSHQPVTGGILTPTAGNNRPRASHSSSHPHQSVSWGTYAAGQLDGVDRAGSSGDDDDEGDLDAEDKKLRRKQSNRESARRSRLRKQVRHVTRFVAAWHRFMEDCHLCVWLSSRLHALKCHPHRALTCMLKQHFMRVALACTG
jgi:hypothetical protein